MTDLRDDPPSADEIVLSVMVFVSRPSLKWRTELRVDESQSEMFRLVAAAHAIRDLLNNLGAGVLES